MVDRLFADHLPSPAGQSPQPAPYRPRPVQWVSRAEKVWLSLGEYPNLKRYLGAYFFFNMGVQTVMYLAATFGSKERSGCQ